MSALKRLQIHAANVVALVCAAVMIGAVLLTAPWAAGEDAAAEADALAQIEAAGVALPEGFQLPEGVDAETFLEQMAQRQARRQGTGAASGQADDASSGGGDLMPAGQADTSASSSDLMPADQTADQASAETISQQPADPTMSAETGSAESDLARYLPYLVVAGALIASAAAIWSTLKPTPRYLAPALIAAGGVIALLYYGYFFLVQRSGAPADAGFWAALAGTAGLFAQVAVPRPALMIAQPPVKASRTPRPQNIVLAQAQPAPRPQKAQPAAPRERRTAPKSAQKGTNINIIQNVRVAIDAVTANKLRSALTMLGIIIGVAAVVSLISVGQSASASVTGQIEGAGANQISITSRGRFASSSLTVSDVETIALLAGVEAVAPQNTGMLTAKSDSGSVDVSIIGTTADYEAANAVGISLGRFLSDDDNAENMRVAVLGAQTAEDLFGGVNPVGREVRIGSVSFEVVGVAESGGSTARMADPDAVVYVPLSTASRRLFSSRSVLGQDLVSSITVLAKDSDDIPTLMDNIEALLREMHDIDADEDSPYGIMSQSVLLDAVESVYGTLTIFLGAIAGISLLVGGIGIMNITLVSVTERTREIGLRKAVGAQHLHILVQFLIETVVLSTTGGVIGILVSVGIIYVVNAAGVMDASLSMLAVALGFGFSVLVGVVFGLYPANRAARLQPIEALRYQ